MLATVVVPVYNPGRDIEPCIESLLAQTLAPEEYEIVFVDDGSTDATPAMLDRLAASRPGVRVFHEPNSGWAGRPRNVGIENARGQYIQFVDQDDTLAPEALERLTDMAVRNGSDVVLPKVASDFRGVALRVYRRNVEAGTLATTPAIDSLTPHKLVRTEFLREHGIRFPEGRRRLEDQLFMVRCYGRAKVISILADYPCYHYRRRTEGTNAGDALPDPAGYLANVREVLDEIVAMVPPGDLRDLLVARFVRVEIVGRISEQRVVPGTSSEDAVARLVAQRQYRRTFIEAAMPLARDFVNESIVSHLSQLQQVRVRLLLGARVDELLQLAERLAPLRAEAVIEEARVGRSGLAVRMATRIVDSASGQPLALEPAVGRWMLPAALTEGILDDACDVTDALAVGRVIVAARNLDTGEEVAMHAATTVVPAPADAGSATAPSAMHLRAAARITPSRASAGAPMGDGTWEFRVRTAAFGLDRIADAVAGRELRIPPPALVAGGIVIRPDRRQDGRLVFSTATAGSTSEALALLSPSKVVCDGWRLEVRLRAAVSSRELPTGSQLVISEGGRELTRPASIHVRKGQVIIRGGIASWPGLRARTGRLKVRFGGPGTPAIDLGPVHRSRLGLRHPAQGTHVPLPRALARRLRAGIGTVRGRVG